MYSRSLHSTRDPDRDGDWWKSNLSHGSWTRSLDRWPWTHTPTINPISVKTTSIDILLSTVSLPATVEVSAPASTPGTIAVAPVDPSPVSGTSCLNTCTEPSIIPSISESLSIPNSIGIATPCAVPFLPAITATAHQLWASSSTFSIPHQDATTISQRTTPTPFISSQSSTFTLSSIYSSVASAELESQPSISISWGNSLPHTTNSQTSSRPSPSSSSSSFLSTSASLKPSSTNLPPPSSPPFLSNLSTDAKVGLILGLLLLLLLLTILTIRFFTRHTRRKRLLVAQVPFPGLIPGGSRPHISVMNFRHAGESEPLIGGAGAGERGSGSVLGNGDGEGGAYRRNMDIDDAGVRWPEKVVLSGEAKEFWEWTNEYEKRESERRKISTERREGARRVHISSLEWGRF